MKAANNSNIPRPPQPPPDPVVAPKPPASYYCSLIVPLQPFAIRGVIWYQGENNCHFADEYRSLFPAMIRAWREAWGQQASSRSATDRDYALPGGDPSTGSTGSPQAGSGRDFPFLFVQLPGHVKIPPDLREAQLLTSQTVPRTAMVTIMDAGGDPMDSHPRKKEPVGARLVLAARAVAYGEKVEYSGPVYESWKVDGARAIVRFTHAAGGLEVKGAALTGFTISGDGKEFVEAQAQIVPPGGAGQPADTIAVWSDKVAKPVAVRYGWVNVPLVNLFNREGLPASPFRTDVPAANPLPKQP